jgi:hypothetical protein
MHEESCVCMSQVVWVTVRHEHLFMSHSLRTQASDQQREVGLLLTIIGCSMLLHENVFT